MRYISCDSQNRNVSPATNFLYCPPLPLPNLKGYLEDICFATSNKFSKSHTTNPTGSSKLPARRCFGGVQKASGGDARERGGERGRGSGAAARGRVQGVAANSTSTSECKQGDGSCIPPPSIHMFNISLLSVPVLPAQPDGGAGHPSRDKGDREWPTEEGAGGTEARTAAHQERGEFIFGAHDCSKVLGSLPHFCFRLKHSSVMLQEHCHSAKSVRMWWTHLGWVWQFECWQWPWTLSWMGFSCVERFSNVQNAAVVTKVECFTKKSLNISKTYE